MWRQDNGFNSDHNNPYVLRDTHSVSRRCDTVLLLDQIPEGEETKLPRAPSANSTRKENTKGGDLCKRRKR